MSEERKPRNSDTREASTRTSDAWVPASILPDPQPQDGWVFRWVRTKTLGESDNVHVSRMFREGWSPVKAEDHPELMLASDMRENDPRMPLLNPERSTRISSFGKN